MFKLISRGLNGKIYIGYSKFFSLRAIFPKEQIHAWAWVFRLYLEKISSR